MRQYDDCGICPMQHAVREPDAVVLLHKGACVLCLGSITDHGHIPKEACAAYRAGGLEAVRALGIDTEHYRSWWVTARIRISRFLKDAVDISADDGGLCIVPIAAKT